MKGDYMKKIHLTSSYVLINLDIAKCNNETEIIKSAGFKMVLDQFIDKLYVNKHNIIYSLPKIDSEVVLNLFKMLLTYDLKDFPESAEKELLTNYQKELYNFVDLFYDYWRKLQRYGLIYISQTEHLHSKKLELIAKTDKVNESILSLYRLIAQKLLGEKFNVYRQLPAGLNANLLYYKHHFTDDPLYECLQGVSCVASIITRPPFIVTTKSNKRQDIFKEVFENPLKKLVSVRKDHYVLFPVMVGPLLAFVYIHRDFLHHGIALANLFELADMKESSTKKPDLVFVFGIRETELDCTYYHDNDKDIYLGFISREDKNDYFGYIKKMLLTLHNVYMIDNGNLPVHGAMAELFTNSGVKKNIVIIGDSGTGKSETLEAIKQIGSNYINEMKIVFDDMGTFSFKDNIVVASGTEVGAFVRLDDLGAGYVFEEMDRAIFLNPSQQNSRLVTPMSSYDYISRKHNIDLVLYANNYEDNDVGLKLFNNKEEALKTFKQGRRIAKGTTNETGLVETYFANPFGPVQKFEQTEKLLDKYFKGLYDQGVIVGEIYTKLALKGQESKGPRNSAKKLLEYLNNNDK